VPVGEHCRDPDAECEDRRTSDGAEEDQPERRAVPPPLTWPRIRQPHFMLEALSRLTGRFAMLMFEPIGGHVHPFDVSGQQLCPFPARTS
jgi:hypothetical protein